MKKLLFTVLCTACLCLSCNRSSNEQEEVDELLIYCGITMVNPIKELAEIFEKENNCSVTITQGGSEDLYQSLKFSHFGELYLPGSESYREKHFEDGLLKDYIYVGYNQASLIVQKGNPKNIPADINVLKNEQYLTVIANPDSCSIGKQSKKILQKQGIYDTVLDHAVLIASDSRTMNKTLHEKMTDVILNWGATAFFKENKDAMDRLKLDETIAPKKHLLLNLLSFARNKELAKKFMLFAASTRGQEVFRKYGFLDSVSKPGEIQTQ
ncbi:MAG: molybdenum ABC transporter substrate-binding protein [Acidobacteria bacterium]|nr:MAG: molybdenum ABC transporter substrate-binding protein [Acidobacteriota bacterium]